MNWKTILSLVGLVLIGYFAGFHHHRLLVKNQIRSIAKTRPGPNSGFEKHFYEKIKATEEQKEKISPVIQKRVKQLYQLDQEMREKRKPVLDSMRLEIEPHLNEDQKAVLEKFINRFRRSPQPRRRKKNGRPPGKIN